MQVEERGPVPTSLERFAVISTARTADGWYRLCATQEEATGIIADEVADVADRLDEYAWRVVDLDAPGVPVRVDVVVPITGRTAVTCLTHPDGERVTVERRLTPAMRARVRP